MANELSSPSKRVADFLEKVKSKRGRIIFILDATGSRKEAWDLASRTQAEMFSEAATLGTLDVQLVYFKGIENYGGECKAGPWTNDANVLARLMSRIRCDTGAADQLRDLLRAVAAFSVGGLTALSDMKSEAAVKLLGQLK
jgi:hypothetical protein